MRKQLIIGLSILSVFLLCSMSYQPIIADEQIDIIPIMEDTQTSISDDECDCNEDIDWDFPIICWILERLWYIIPQFSPFPVPLMHWVIIFINEIFDCPNIP